MRIAILADIHANLEALQACLDHAVRQGVDRYILLGDLVGYGSDATACVELAERLWERGALVIRGNHDQAVVSGWCEGMAFAARDGIYHARACLTAGALAFLEALPLSATEGEILFVHASPAHAERWPYLVAPQEIASAMAASPCRLTCVGHVHVPALHYAGKGPQREVFRFDPMPGVAVPLLASRKWLVVAGAVGQPRDGDNRACYHLLDLAAMTVTCHRVPYDYATTMDKIMAAGLAASNAHRLARGQ